MWKLALSVALPALAILVAALAQLLLTTIWPGVQHIPFPVASADSYNLPSRRAVSSRSPTDSPLTAGNGSKGGIRRFARRGWGQRAKTNCMVNIGSRA